MAWRDLTENPIVLALVPLPRPSRLPVQPPTGLPVTRVVSPTGILQASAGLGQDVSVWMYVVDTWTEVTAYVKALDFFHGWRERPRFGGVAEGAVGLLYLDDVSAVWSVINPNSRIDAYSGAPIAVYWGSARTRENLLFRGWTKGVQNKDIEGVSVAVMPIYSRLQRIADFGDAILANLEGTDITVSQVMAEICDHLEIEASERLIESSDVLVSIGRLNASGLFSSGRRKRTSPLGAINALGQLEGGFVHDDRFGRLVSTKYDGLGRGEANAVRVLPDQVGSQFVTLDTTNSIINIIEASSDAFVSVGRRSLAQDAQGQLLPYSVNLLPTQGTEREYIVFDLSEDESWVFANVWVTPVKGTHYTFEPDTGFARLDVINRTETEMILGFVNLNLMPVAVTIRDIEVEPFKSQPGELFDPIRDSASIERYGERSVEYRYELVHSDRENVAEVRERLHAHVEEFKGVLDGNPRPRVPALLELPDWDLADGIFEVHDIVVFGHTKLGVTVFENKAWWVVGVGHHIDAREWNIELYLLEVWDGRVDTVVPGQANWRDLVDRGGIDVPRQPVVVTNWVDLAEIAIPGDIRPRWIRIIEPFTFITRFPSYDPTDFGNWQNIANRMTIPVAPVAPPVTTVWVNIASAMTIPVAPVTPVPGATNWVNIASAITIPGATVVVTPTNWVNIATSMTVPVALGPSTVAWRNIAHSITVPSDPSAAPTDWEDLTENAMSIPGAVDTGGDPVVPAGWVRVFAIDVDDI